MVWSARHHGIKNLSVHQQAALMAEGWAGLYAFHAVEPCEQHAMQALRRFYATDAQVRAGWEAAVDASLSGPRKRANAAEWRDYAETEGRSIHRFMRRRPVSFNRPTLSATA